MIATLPFAAPLLNLSHIRVGIRPTKTAVVLRSTMVIGGRERLGVPPPKSILPDLKLGEVLAIPPR
jgi:hypothetical protein